MDIKMKKPALVLSLFVLVVVCAILLPMALNSALAAPAMDPVSGHGSSTASGPITFAGTATFFIRGEQHDATFVATILGEPVFNDEGVLHGRVMHEFDFGDGNELTTVGDVVMEPIDMYGLFTMNENNIVVSGAGDYAETTGRILIHGLFHFAEGWADFDMNGVISG